MSAPTTHAGPRFEDIPCRAPDLAQLASQTRAIRSELARARTVEPCLAALKRWDVLRRAVSTYAALVDLRFQQDTTDAERKHAREAWDEAEPRWTELLVDVKRDLLAHPLRVELESVLGGQAFALWRSEVLAFDPAIKQDLASESLLEAEYIELLASARLDFRGESLDLTTILKYRQDADRALRHAAEAVLWGWFRDQRQTLDRIFDDLTRLRARMAEKLGQTDFVELGYRRMCRVDYDRADVERLRAEVVRAIVPLTVELRERQARRLGCDPLMAWDEPVHDPAGNPKPHGDRAQLVACAQAMFDRMGHGLGAFFRRMERGGFLDLATRPGKGGGGFCTAFPTHGMPFVFANFNGTKGDVEVLTHEIGHAFQSFESRELWPSDYLWPTLESCEVHSMGLELLTWPHMESFFGEEAERFRRAHLTESLLFLAYGTAVDHFQHLVHESPDASPRERHAMWQAMERTYLPSLRWGDLEHPAAGGRWQHQRHIYLDPFYYIDYVLAQTCALQLWQAAELDRERAMAVYVALCRRGGSAPFQELVRSAGLSSPFDEGCLARVAAHARRSLDD